MRLYIAFCLFYFASINSFAQIDQSQQGAWYMYFFNHQFDKNNWGVQGDVQYRNWNVVGDLEQLLVRTGVTYTPKETNLLLTLGVAHITTGDFGDSNDTFAEFRFYQEALLPQKVGNRFYLTHRFRYEQRFVEDQDFRTRYRYNLFLNVPLNKTTLEKGAIYTAFYNELFINGQTEIGEGRTVQLFDRNRTYLGMGYTLNPTMRVQLGWMNQKTTNVGKGQLQFSLHHNF